MLTEPYEQWKEKWDAYMDSEHWKILRGVKFRERGKRCFNCGGKFLIHVHHIRYKNFFDCKAEDLIVLCEECHVILHKAIRCSKLEIEDVTEVNVKDVINSYGSKPKTQEWVKDRRERLAAKHPRYNRVQKGHGQKKGRKRRVLTAVHECGRHGYRIDAIRKLISDLEGIIADTLVQPYTISRPDLVKLMEISATDNESDRSNHPF